MGRILKPWANVFEWDTDHQALSDILVRRLGRHWKIFLLTILGAVVLALQITVHPWAQLRWSLTFFSLGIALQSSLCTLLLINLLRFADCFP